MLRSLAAACAALFATAVVADEGMWTFDNVPQAAIQKKYNITLDKPWLDKLQRSITRFESGCTGSFVSPDGLVLTNHHCAMSCLAELSSTSANYVDDGFHAGTRSQEKKCPTQILSVLVEMENVTAKVAAATAGLADAQANQARKQELSKLEAACTSSSKNSRGGPLACESVTLYQGGQYYLYKYRRYDDVRLVFAPHHAIGAFGGDPDNFNFPRWSLDFSLMRVYDKGKPARTPNHLSWRIEGPQEGEPTFIAGHPGSTSRLLTVEQLRFQRDVSVPSYLIRNSELRGRMIQYGKTGDEPARIVSDYLQSVENALKVYRGFQTALLDDGLFARKTVQERELRERVKTDPKLEAAVGEAWKDAADAQERYRQIYDRYLFLESGAGFNSKLFGYARQLVRGAAERGKSNEQRLREYAESNLPKIASSLLATTPLYPEFEQVTLSFSLDKLRETLGPDDSVVRKLLSTESPESLAAKLITQSKLGDPAVRKALWDGGAAAVAASNDPMIALARDIDGEARAVRKIYEDEVQAPVAAAQERIAKARFAVLGTNTYPDATFTLRLSYGAVAGWTEKGQPVEPFTQLSRLYERTTGKDPFRLPQVWLDARDKLDMSTPFCFVTTNDIVGGNSGSPLVDSQGRLVGLAFDGNKHSIAGSFWYDGEMNRTVAVHPAIIIAALRDVYGAQDLAKELLDAR
ncbi:S46 family peptidase [Steroidobacter sp. S1-65]|uniref:Dipeptidyl-peptidase n=1 Tax=Steroidobacter gossypii TaxID=2805490 RepID=A0ABS1WU18_9GAMM|nr:S46 family peptidase [Steroidobacter gossypii]MBM0104471.1 S46 family peptidase [Steroidobacter gossypii]